jgi:glucose/arabinose dehydrogenase
VRDLPAPGLVPTFFAVLGALLCAPVAAVGQAGVSYQIPPDNPFAGQPGAAPEVYALGLRNPYRFSFDRQTGDLLIGDVGGSQREEVDWIGPYAARGANFGWPCQEGKAAGPGGPRCPVANPVEPLFDYQNTPGAVVTAGFVVRDGALPGLAGRALFADFGAGAIQSLQLNPANPAPAPTGASVPTLASFGEDALGRLYAASLGPPGGVFRLAPGPGPGLLSTQPIPGTWDQPLAIAGVPGDAGQLLVAQRAGLVRRVAGGQAVPAPFLDLTGSVTTDGERGLLSVASAPDFVSSGRFYVYYTDLVGNIHVDEFTRSATDPGAADPTSRRQLLAIEHSNASNHNGGQLQFGPDGCLWITTGDGGGQSDQFDNAQNVATHKGKILRIDPDPPGRGGPVCRLPPLPPPAAPTSAGPAPDTLAPRLRTRIKRRQRVLRLRGVVAYARCSEPCTIATGGTLRIRSRRFRMLRASRAAQVTRTSRIKVRLTRRGTRALRRALRHKRRASVRIGLRAADRAGNRSRLVRATVRVRRHRRTSRSDARSGHSGTFVRP